MAWCAGRQKAGRGWHTGGVIMGTTRGSGARRPRLEPDDEQSSRPVLRGLGLGNEARLPDRRTAMCLSLQRRNPRQRAGSRRGSSATDWHGPSRNPSFNLSVPRSGGSVSEEEIMATNTNDTAATATSGEVRETHNLIASDKVEGTPVRR